MGDARVIRFLCLKCDKEVKGSIFRSDMVTCNCGNIHIVNPDQLTIKDWDLVKVRQRKIWWKINEL